MSPKEEIIKAIRIHAEGGACTDCPYGRENNCTSTLMKDTLKLIDWYEGVL